MVVAVAADAPWGDARLQQRPQTLVKAVLHRDHALGFRAVLPCHSGQLPLQHLERLQGERAQRLVRGTGVERRGRLGGERQVPGVRRQRQVHLGGPAADQLGEGKIALDGSHVLGRQLVQGVAPCVPLVGDVGLQHRQSGRLVAFPSVEQGAGDRRHVGEAPLREEA